MSEHDDHEFFKLRKASKTYISKVFTFNARNRERIRNVRMILEGSDSMHFGEMEEALCLRLTGSSRKTQVTALVSQDEKRVKRLTLQTFKSRAGEWYESIEKDEFTFRADEFSRLIAFLSQIEFIDLSNEENFHIEDISTKDGPKAIIDASDRGVVERIKGMSESQREAVLVGLQTALTDEEINILLGRKQALEEFESKLQEGDWTEAEWQDFFDREQWVFGTVSIIESCVSSTEK